MLALAALALSMPVMAAVNFNIDGRDDSKAMKDIIKGNTACLDGDNKLTNACASPRDPLNPDSTKTWQAIIPGGPSPSASSNNVTITGWTESSSTPSTGYSVAGGYNASGNAMSNTLTIKGTSVITGNIYGGYSNGLLANSNEVTIDGTSTINGNVYGGYSASGEGELFHENYLTKNSKESEIKGTVSVKIRLIINRHKSDAIRFFEHPFFDGLHGSTVRQGALRNVVVVSRQTAHEGSTLAQ